MRISAGLLKGKKVGSGKISARREGKEGFRPTSSKVREALFDILKDSVADAVFLDLYAGSGTVGFEALSRGADQCCFVESNLSRFREIISSISRMGLDSRAVAFREEAYRFLSGSSKRGITFGIIFADPPYASEEVSRIFALLDENNVLREGGLLIIEHSSKKVFRGNGRSLRFVRNYKYGDTMLTLFRKES